MARFAVELRAWRQRHGWSQAEIADKLGYSGSHVSSVETMTRLPVADFAQGCDEIFSTPGTFIRLQEDITKEAYPPWFSAFVHFEAKATRIHCWDNRCLTGLIQSEDYARSIIRAGNLDASDDEVALDVAARLQRQQIMQRDRPPYCWFVVHESALRTTFGAKTIMDVLPPQGIHLLRERGLARLACRPKKVSAGADVADILVARMSSDHSDSASSVSGWRGVMIVESRSGR